MMPNAEDHRTKEKVELGYGRLVCAVCDVDWPCPTYAQLPRHSDGTACYYSGHKDDAPCGRIE